MGGGQGQCILPVSVVRALHMTTATDHQLQVVPTLIIYRQCRGRRNNTSKLFTSEWNDAQLQSTTLLPRKGSDPSADAWGEAPRHVTFWHNFEAPSRPRKRVLFTALIRRSRVQTTRPTPISRNLQHKITDVVSKTRTTSRILHLAQQFQLIMMACSRLQLHACQRLLRSHWVVFCRALRFPGARAVVPRVQNDGSVLSAHMGRANSTRPMRGCSCTPLPLFACLRQSPTYVHVPACFGVLTLTRTRPARRLPQAPS